MFSFISHRITGFILILGGLVILISLSVIMMGKDTFEDMLVLVQLPGFKVLAHILVIALFWHVLNGIKILIIDLFRAGRLHKVLTWIMILIFITGLTLYFIYLFPGIFPK
jgi:succinate dehydrogenase / fumarate reductase cytochrome b subunit